MGYKLKFKLYDSKKNEIVDYIDRSIAIADGTVQSFDRQGNLQGTAVNTHLTPIQYTNRDDADGKEIYQGFIIERKSKSKDEEIVGVVESLNCCWWIINHKEQRAVPLHSNTAIDRIIGTIYQNKDLKEFIM